MRIKEIFDSCLIGGAVGDALGAPVEFLSSREILRNNGDEGVKSFIEYSDGSGEFTDDTQMTIFTALGLARAGETGDLSTSNLKKQIYAAYKEWLATQESVYSDSELDSELSDFARKPELNRQRAPGLTCLGALRSGEIGSAESPLNDSKGCGGVMRAAPVGLYFYKDPERAFAIGEISAAITHGHPSGYLSAGAFAAIIASLAFGENLTSAIETAIHFLKKRKNSREVLSAIDAAIEYSEKRELSPNSLDSLGAGWVGEEALSMALFCAVKSGRDFRSGVLAAINCGGDSDSVGSICGNMLGIIGGKESIPKEWIKKLKYSEIVFEISEKLYKALKQ